jgi:hypothetical protein
MSFKQVNHDLEEFQRQKKRSRQSRDLLHDDDDSDSDLNVNIRYKQHGQQQSEAMVPSTPSHPVKRTFSNAGSVPSRFVF